MDIQNKTESARIIMSGFKRNTGSIPEWLKAHRHIDAVMEGACGFGEDMMRAAGWQDDMSCNANQQQEEQENQGESSEMVHHLSMQNVIQTAPEELDDMIVVQANIDITPLFAGADESLVAQSAQLMRDGGFSQTKPLDQFADTDFPFKQGRNDEDTRRIAQRVKQIGKIGCDFGGDGFLWHRSNPAADALLIITIRPAIFFKQEGFFQSHLNMNQHNAQHCHRQGGGGWHGE